MSAAIHVIELDLNTDSKPALLDQLIYWVGCAHNALFDLKEFEVKTDEDQKDGKPVPIERLRAMARARTEMDLANEQAERIRRRMEVVTR